MALRFVSASADVVTFASTSGTLDLQQGAILMRIRYNATGAACMWSQDAAVAPHVFNRRGDNVLQMSFSRVGGAGASATSAVANFSAYAINEWLDVACVWDINAAAGDQKLFVGRRDIPLEPPSSITQALGSGSLEAGTGGIVIGNFPNLGQAMKGDIQSLRMFRRPLSLGQLILEQNSLRPRDSSIVRWVEFGNVSHTSKQYDKSAFGDLGTVSQALFTPGPVTRLRSVRRGLMDVTAAAPGTAAPYRGHRMMLLGVQ